MADLPNLMQQNVGITEVQFKVGDKLRYVGPPRSVYQHQASHYDFYQDHEIIEIVAEKFPGMTDFLCGSNMVFAFVRCKERQRPNVTCGGFQLLDPKNWKVVTNGG